jgi:enoyl-CoA hydratase
MAMRRSPANRDSAAHGGDVVTTNSERPLTRRTEVSLSQTVLYERQDRIGFITMNRPHVLNAINDAWIHDFVEATNAGRHDREARVIIVRGAGRAFCAGADLKETPTQRTLPDHLAEHTEPMQEIARIFRRMGKPVIAQLHGYVVGGGCEIAMLADVRIAAADTKIGFTEVKVGATVTMGGLYNLTRIVGAGRAFELLYTAELIDVSEALRIGFVNRVAPLAELEVAVATLAERIAGHFPFELALTRNSVYRALDMDFDAALEEEALAALVSHAGGSRTRGMAQAVKNIREGKGR